MFTYAGWFSVKNLALSTESEGMVPFARRTARAVLLANGTIPSDSVERAKFFTENHPAYVNMLGIPTLATGVFGGIIVGVLAALLFNRFYTIELPQYLGFFAGKRFVPIVTSISALILGLIMLVMLKKCRT